MTEIHCSATVVGINGKMLQAMVQNRSACHGCCLQAQCASTECRKKLIEIPIQNPSKYQQGQKITVSLQETSGWKAVFYAYILPLLLVLTVLGLARFITENEILAGTYAFLSIFPYYLLLFFFRKHFQKQIRFKIVENEF